MKRFLILILAVMILSLSVMTGFAETIDIFDDWSVQLSEDGSGYVVTACASESDTVSVPDALGGLPVTAIGDFAFYQNETMQSLVLPKTLVSVGEYAFSGCSSLADVRLPVSLAELGEGAFSECPMLSSVNLKDTALTVVRSYTFMNCGLSELKLPECCTVIEDDAFCYCTSALSLYIPDAVMSIGEDAFLGCDDLTIVCSPSSYASEYARAHGINCRYVVPFTVYYRGDADYDLMITIMDATRIQRFLAELDMNDIDGILIRGDVNGNGLDIMDATAIQRFIADLDDPYAIGELIFLE